jgi:hypothetical protein
MRPYHGTVAKEINDAGGEALFVKTGVADAGHETQQVLKHGDGVIVDKNHARDLTYAVRGRWMKGESPNGNRFNEF